MTNDSQYMALDIGDVRIGVALASAEARLPRAVETIDRQKTDPLTRIKQLIAENGVTSIVAGLPRDMNGNETVQTELARSFAGEVSQVTGINVEFTDEAGTSLAAEEILKESGKPYEKSDIDMQAAAIILEDWLAAGVKG